MKKSLRSLFLSLFFVFSLVFSPLVNAGDTGVGGGCGADSDCASNSCVNGICQANTNTGNSSGGTKDVEINLAEYLTLKDGSRVDETFSTPADMVNIIVRVVFLVAGVILFIMVVVAGFTMITGANKQDLEKSKKTISGAAVGFIAMFAAYWIMQLLSMITGANIGF